MPFLRRAWSLAALVLAAGLAAQSPESRPTSQPTSRPTSRPSGATGTAEALALGRKVVEFAGGREAFEEVGTIAWTFRGARRLFWDRVAGVVRVENLAEPRDGQPQWTALVYDVAADRESVPGGSADAEPPVSAKSIWINDAYWLLVTLKVLDPGVALSLDAPADDDPADVARLRLRFEDVGETPANEYVLHVEQATGKVIGWDYYKTPDATPHHWAFEGWTDVGPLHLSLARPSPGGRIDIDLTDVEVDVPPPAGLRDAPGRLLAPR